MAVWHLTLCMHSNMWNHLPMIVLFFRSGRGTKIQLIQFVISVYGMITSKAMKIIWFMSSSLFACPDLGCYICGFINNCTQPVGGTEDDFPQPFTSFSPSGLTHHFLRMLSSLWVLTTPYSSCWFCSVSSVQSTTHGVRMEISREVSRNDLWLRSIPWSSASCPEMVAVSLKPGTGSVWGWGGGSFGLLVGIFKASLPRHSMVLCDSALLG